MKKLIVIALFLCSGGCTITGQKFYDQSTGRWYYRPDGIALFNPLADKTGKD